MVVIIDFEKFQDQNKRLEFIVNEKENLIDNEIIRTKFNKTPFKEYLNIINYFRGKTFHKSFEKNTGKKLGDYIVERKTELFEKTVAKNPKAFDGTIGVLKKKRNLYNIIKKNYNVSKSTYFTYMTQKELYETGKITLNEYLKLFDIHHTFASAASVSLNDGTQIIQRRALDLLVAPGEIGPGGSAGQVDKSFVGNEFILEKAIKEETFEELGIGPDRIKKIYHTGLTRDVGGRVPGLHIAGSSGVSVGYLHVDLNASIDDIILNEESMGKIVINDRNEMKELFLGTLGKAALTEEQKTPRIKEIYGNENYLINGNNWGVLFKDFSKGEIRNLAKEIASEHEGKIIFREGLFKPKRIS